VVHQGAGLVGGEGRLLAGPRAQHIFQKIGEGAGVIALHPAGRKAHAAPQQPVHGGGVPHLEGLGQGGPAHRGQGGFALFAGLHRLVEGGGGGAGGVPGLAQQVQGGGGGGGQVRRLQRGGGGVQALLCLGQGAGH